MQNILNLCDPYSLNKQAPQKTLCVSLLNKVMRLEALAHVGVNELLLESNQWDSTTVHHFSLLAEMTTQCREIYEVLLLRLEKQEQGAQK